MGHGAPAGPRSVQDGQRPLLRRGLRRAAELLRSRAGCVLLLTLGAIQLGKLAWMTTPPDVYAKDFRQDYCIARAWLEGAPLYDPLPEQTRRYIGSDIVPLPSPSAHPPSAAFLFVPLALLPYRAATVVWLGLNLGLLLWCLRTLALGLGFEPTVIALALLLSGALVWTPVFNDLQHGQLTIALLTCAVASWSALRAARFTVAGVGLGLGASIKLLPAYLVAWLLTKGYRRTVAVAALVFVGLQLPALVRFGPALWRDYLLRVVPVVTATYEDTLPNLSLYGLVYRHTAGHPYAAPLLAVSTRGLTLLADALVVLTCLAVSRHPPHWPNTEAYDLEWSVMVIALLLLSPITWLMSCVLLLLPIGVFVRGFARRSAAIGRLGVRHVLVLLGISAPQVLLMPVAIAISKLSGAEPGAALTGPTALVLSVPNFALIAAFAIACKARVRVAARPAGPT